MQGQRDSRKSPSTEEGSAIPVRMLGREIAWLRDRGVETRLLASLFDTNRNHIRQIDLRARRRGAAIKIPEPLREAEPSFDPPAGLPPETAALLGIRSDEEATPHYKPQRDRIDLLEEEVERTIAGFFDSLPSGEGLATLRSFLPRIGYPADKRLIRLRARIIFQIAVTQIHLGRAASGVVNGIKSLHLSRRAYMASGDPIDLRRAAHAAEVVAQAFVLRCEPIQARKYLTLHRSMVGALGENPSPDVLRQFGVVRLMKGDFAGARRNLAAARRAWRDKVERTGRMPDHEIPNFGPRQSNLLPPVDWDGAQETFDQAVQLFKPGHIQRAMNLNWTAACGLATDSRSVQRQAVDLLEKHSGMVTPYGHQSTNFKLLLLTPSLRPTLRPHWARRVLYANAFRDR